MATIATILDRLALVRGAEEVSSRLRVQEENPYRIRPVAMEDVFFFAKRIDNSRVVRQADPRAGRTYWRFFFVSAASSAVLIAAMLPGFYGMFAGSRIEGLRQEHVSLVRQRAVLEMQEAKVLNPDRLREVARRDRFVDPNPDSVVHLEEKQDTTEARWIRPRGPAGN